MQYKPPKTTRANYRQSLTSPNASSILFWLSKYYSMSISQYSWRKAPYPNTQILGKGRICPLKHGFGIAELNACTLQLPGSQGSFGKAEGAGLLMSSSFLKLASQAAHSTFGHKKLVVCRAFRAFLLMESREVEKFYSPLTQIDWMSPVASFDSLFLKPAPLSRIKNPNQTNKQ